ncbi:MAG: DUF2231 domain-containing protein [Candidatus Dormibacteria bacterium]
MVDLPKHPVLRGHPVHAMLTDLPIGLLPGAIAATVAARGKRRRSPQSRLSDALTLMTFASGAGAAAFGIWDWLTIPRDHAAWTPATLHGLVNATGLAVLGAAVLSPRRRLLALATVGGVTLVGAWLGGELVFSHGWRVKPAEEYEIVAERVRAGADGTALGEAEREVESFERQKTFLAR